MIWTVSFLLTFAGFWLLALSQSRHHRTLFGTAPVPGRTKLFRATGCALLIAATALCIRAFSIGYGLVAITAILNLAGITVALMLTYSDRWRLPRSR